MAHCTSLENSSGLDERRHLQNAHPGPWLETHGTESWMALGPPSDQGPHSSCWSAGLTGTAWAEHIGRPSSWGLRGSSRRSVAKSHWTLCDPMDCSTPGFPVLHYLPEFSQTHVHGLVMPSSHLVLCCSLSSCPQFFPASGPLPMSQLFISGEQSIGTPASASVLTMNIQGEESYSSLLY